MTWPEIGEIADDPLATIGAHTVNHVMLKKASDEAVRNEMRQSAAVIEAALGDRPKHFSYPVGDRTSAGPREFAIAAELGFKTAVTTRPGVLFPEHAAHLTALPRISLNGEYQQSRYAKVLMSGAATALWNRFRRVRRGVGVIPGVESSLVIAGLVPAVPLRDATSALRLPDRIACLSDRRGFKREGVRAFARR